MPVEPGTMSAMIQGIDHLVIASADPDAAASELEERLGLAATGGGRHEGAGTFNRIVWLADAYLELIGVDDPSLARERPLGRAVIEALDERGGGLVTFALGVDHLEPTAERLRGAGSSIGPVTHGSRRRPDGESVEWWTAQFEPIAPDGPPFLIQHAFTGAEWGLDALQVRRAFLHPLGSPAMLVRLDLATDDPPSQAAAYAAELGLEFWAVSDLAVCTIGRHSIRLVPRTRMPVPAVVTLGAAIETPRTQEALGLRFDVEHVELPLPAPNRA
jgi:hypothetical protein